MRAFFGVDDEHQLWRECFIDDALVPDDDTEISVENGEHFYTVSKKING